MGDELSRQVLTLGALAQTQECLETNELGLDPELALGEALPVFDEQLERSLRTSTSSPSRNAHHAAPSSRAIAPTTHFSEVFTSGPYPASG